MRRRNDAHVHVHGALTAHALERSVLQYTKQTHLSRQRQFTYLVQKQRAAIGSLEPAFARRDGSGEGTFLVAEELGIDQFRGHRPAVDPHDRTFAARRALMNGAGYHFFAGSGFPEDQYGRVCVSHLFYGSHYPAQPTVFTY